MWTTMNSGTTGFGSTTSPPASGRGLTSSSGILGGKSPQRVWGSSMTLRTLKPALAGPMDERWTERLSGRSCTPLMCSVSKPSAVAVTL